MSSQPTPYPLRMPEDLRARLTERSLQNGRSLHSEIIGILQEAVDKGNSRALPVLDIDALAAALASKLAAELKKE